MVDLKVIPGGRSYRYEDEGEPASPWVFVWAMVMAGLYVAFAVVLVIVW